MMMLAMVTTVIFEVMMLSLVPSLGNACGVTSYRDAKADWTINGVREGYKLECIMSSQRTSDIKFLYMTETVSARETVKWLMKISTMLAPGPIDAVVNAGLSEPIKLKGVVAEGSITFNLKTDTREDQRVQDAISGESALKITLNRQGTPVDTITASLDGASNALVSFAACVRRLGHLGD